MKTKLLIPLLIALISAGFAHAKEAAKIIDPKAKAILEKSIQAIGSKEAIARIKTRHMVGKMEMPAQGISMTLEMKQKDPLMFYMKASLPNVMTTEQGYDGKEGWSKDSIQGSRKLAGAELAQAKESAAMFLEKQILDNLVEAKILPDDKEGEKTFTVIQTKTKDDSTKTLYFDQTTHLLTRSITKTAIGPGGKMEIDSRLSDYKEIDGIKSPQRMTATVGPMKVVMTFSKIEYNQEIPDDIFKMKK